MGTQEDTQVQSVTLTRFSDGMRPVSDIDAFFLLLPSCVGGYISKYSDTKTITDLAIALARETAGRLVTLGVCNRAMMCSDELPLAAMAVTEAAATALVVTASAPALASAPTLETRSGPTLGDNNGHGVQGACVAHFPSQQVQKIQGL